MTSPDNKYSLLLDSCNGFRLGLLDEKYQCIEFLKFDEKKASNILFNETQNILEKYNISLPDLKHLFLIMGPGSYTGIRLLQGMKELYSEMGIDVLSFYLFEIPGLANQESGQFVISAYKQEFYHYCWDQSGVTQKLLKKEELTSLNADVIFSVDDNVGDLATENVYKVLQEHCSTVFENVVAQKLQRESFYFRPLDQEFKVNFPDIAND